MAFSKTDDMQEQNTVKAAEILIAIPTLNEQDHIETCIRSLLCGDERLTNVKMVVADGGSTDKTVEIVTDLQATLPNLHIIHNEKRLQSAAVNLVSKTEALETHRYLIRCDAHAAYPPDYILKVADALRATDAASVVVCMDAVGETCFQKANAWVVDTPLGSGGSAHRGGKISGFCDHGHHAGFRLDTFLKVGGYDETFSHNEDAEYDYRLARSGGKIWLDASIRLDYLPRATLSGLIKQYHNYGQGRARNVLKHGTRPKLRQLAPVINLIGCLGALAIAPILPLALLYPAFYVSLLIISSVWISFRKKSACGLLAGLAAGAMHMAWATGFLRQLVRSRT
ncbi:MAG: glycosyltransferase family 2 protein [Pseudomonadota bacterium]